MLQQLDIILDETRRALEAAPDAGAVEEIRVRVLGRKGDLTAILRGLAQVPPDERPRIGQRANQVKEAIQTAVDARKAALAGGDSGPALDLTLPGRTPVRGHLHPLTLTRRAIEQVFMQMGYTVATGPQIETDYYNFEALNLPDGHPAREMHDTFYVEGGRLLRTHTSPVQIRTMEKGPPPVRIIAPGVAYRRDDDVTHSPQFQQVEGLAVDRGITFGDLKGTLQVFVHGLFGREIGVRFRPSFFPFTEPSAEVDMQCVICGGGGCRVCSQTGWLEILGCGMVDPAVFGFVGYDPEEYTGFAFGMGIDRIAMLRYGLDDMRLLYENDLRMLEQF